MKKSVLKRSLSILLIISILLPAFTVSAFAAAQTVSGFNVEGLSAKAELSGTGEEWNAPTTNSLQGSATGYKIAGFIKLHSTATLTITNTSGDKGKLRFTYTSTPGNGTCSINPKSEENAPSVYSKTLLDGESVTITIESASGSGTSSFSLFSVTFVPIKEVNITFKTSEGGSYLVGDNAIADGEIITQSSTVPYILSATSDNDHKLGGWVQVDENGQTFFSNDAKTEVLFKTDATVYPVFINKEDCFFKAGNMCFTDLNEANSYASNHGNKIVLVSSGTLPAANYTISSGNTLLIPFDSLETCYGTEGPSAVYIDNGTNTHTLFRKLTMSDGASITIESGATLSVSAKLHAIAGNATNGCTMLDYGQIEMLGDSKITVNGNLCCYGYITGNGKIVANSTASVHEVFEICEFRGGKATSNMLKNSQKVFLLSQYYIQNIQVPMTLLSGATLHGHAAVTANDRVYTTSAVIVGNGGLFQLSSGKLTKQYLPTEDRCQFDVDNGTVSISSVTLELLGVKINSADYVLPINSHFNINLLNGSTVKISNNVEFLPGVKMTIDQTSEMEIVSGKALYVYDSEEWTAGNYVFSGKKLQPAQYAPTRSKTRTVSDLTDVIIDVNGKITVDGDIYTTSSGASIISSEGTGAVKFTSNVSTDGKLYQGTTNKNYNLGVNFVQISITPAQLHNGDDSYTLTENAVRGDEYHYCSNCNKWYKVGNHHLVNLYVNDSETAVEQCTDDTSLSFENIEYPALDEITYEPAKTAAKASYDSATKTLTVNGLDAETTTVHVYTARAEVVTVDSEGTSSSKAYSTIQKAINNCTDGSYIRMITDSSEKSLELTKNVYLDLNGKTVTLTEALSGSGKLYGMDTSVTDYKNEPAGRLVLAGGAPADLTEKDGMKYVAHSDASGYSFHLCNLYISGYRYELNRGAKNDGLNGEGALIFQATLQGNTTVQDAVKAFSFTIAGKTVATDKDGKPVAMNGGKFEGYWYTKKVNLYMDKKISAVANVTVGTALFSSAEVTLNFNDAMSNAASA